MSKGGYARVKVMGLQHHTKINPSRGGIGPRNQFAVGIRRFIAANGPHNAQERCTGALTKFVPTPVPADDEYEYF